MSRCGPIPDPIEVFVEVREDDAGIWPAIATARFQRDAAADLAHAEAKRLAPTLSKRQTSLGIWPFVVVPKCTWDRIQKEIKNGD